MEISQDVARATFKDSPPEHVLEDLVGELKARNYRIARINNIDNVLERELPEDYPAHAFRFYKIVEFCNLNECSQLISANLLAGVFMPARFIVFQRQSEAQTQLAFLKPTAFARLFDSEDMLRWARTLEKDMHEILEELSF